MNHTENIVLEQYIRYCLDVQKIGIILTVLSEYFEDNTYDLKDELQVIEKVNDGKIVRGVWYLLYGHLLITGGIFLDCCYYCLYLGVFCIS